MQDGYNEEYNLHKIRTIDYILYLITIIKLLMNTIQEIRLIGVFIQQ